MVYAPRHTEGWYSSYVGLDQVKGVENAFWS